MRFVSTHLVLAAALVASASAGTLDTIKQRGQLACGVNVGLAGFSIADSQGKWVGLDVDFCRAVAAAVLGDGTKVKFTPLSAQQRFTALQSGEVDVLSRNTTWTLTRDTSLGLDFAGIDFYDGQGFLVPKKLGVKSAKDLKGATVCVQPGTTTELNLADYSRANGLALKPVVIEKFEEFTKAYFAGRCDAMTTDVSALASIRATLAPAAGEQVLLPETISKEPFGPAVRQGDPQWADVVRWVLQALIEAEEQGLTAANVVEQSTASPSPNVKRLLGTTAGMGQALGLSEKWALEAIRQVGNYGEIFERNVGKGSPLGLDRGPNQLWTKGGLIYALPIR
ncbi:MAG: amino acid ABC transporter substrate-binding protein [Deltaproteobacteria bacterium]|nr:amino acid ABC transporter substrate-binding protein [Deltaproteobacteria bacterium]